MINTLRSYAGGVPIVATALLMTAAFGCTPAAQDEGGASQAAEEQEAAGEQRVAEAAGVEAAHDAFLSAWEQEDQEGVVGAFTEDAVAYDPVPPGKFEGTEGIGTWASDAFEELDGIDITTTDLAVHTEGRVAWVTARYVFAAQPTAEDAEPIRDEGHLSMIWVLQEDGSYQSPLFHASNLPEAPAEEGTE